MPSLKNYSIVHLIVEDEKRHILRTRCRTIEAINTPKGYYTIHGKFDVVTLDVSRVNCESCIERMGEDLLEKL